MKPTGVDSSTNDVNAWMRPLVRNDPGKKQPQYTRKRDHKIGLTNFSFAEFRWIEMSHTLF